MPSDWYRRKTWSPEDEADFFARLKRAKAPNQSQYLRIQAVELLQTRERPQVLGAISLVDNLVDEYPDRTQLAGAWLVRAECAEFLGQIGEAIDAYRKSIDQQRIFPYSRNDADLKFGWLVATTPLPALFDEVLGVLEEKDVEIDLTFPVQEYQYYCILALICSELGDNGAARPSAKRALDAAAREHSGFARHANLGLVEGQDAAIYAKLLELSS